jgi:putative nucleotidyltransferase with HDIG domain
MIYGMSDSRMAHSLSVAKKMEQLASEYGLDAREAFTVGLLHDIGYEFCEQQKDHPIVGGEMLKAQGFKYWQEVSCHGKVNQKYSSQMLRLLNYADMTTGPNGESLQVSERLADIARRYGLESCQYLEAVELSKTLF